MITKNKRKYDVLTFGRSSIDLYSNDLGAPFEQIKSFNAYVGGSSTNIAVGCNRLNLRTALLTALGQDKVGDFILAFLRQEGVITEYIPRIEGARTSAVLLGIEPPDKFPLVYYRENAADIQVNVDHVNALNFSEFEVIVLSGTALSREPSRSATYHAASLAQNKGTVVLLDLDFRADQWSNPLDYGISIKGLLHDVDIVIGTEEEVLATNLYDSSQLTIKDQQISNPLIKGNLEESIDNLLKAHIDKIIVKKGAGGASIKISGQDAIIVPGFIVDVKNILGAGDAFAAGYVYGLINGWDDFKAIRFANAMGAIMVTKHGCANFMPNLEEVLTFIAEQGGL